MLSVTLSYSPPPPPLEAGVMQGQKVVQSCSFSHREPRSSEVRPVRGMGSLGLAESVQATWKRRSWPRAPWMGELLSRVACTPQASLLPTLASHPCLCSLIPACTMLAAPAGTGQHGPGSPINPIPALAPGTHWRWGGLAGDKTSWFSKQRPRLAGLPGCPHRGQEAAGPAPPHSAPAGWTPHCCSTVCSLPGVNFLPKTIKSLGAEGRSLGLHLTLGGQEARLGTGCRPWVGADQG